ncbi:MAG: hypothetical protein V4719_14365 [Planctomycetota bacterium]
MGFFDNLFGKRNEPGTPAPDQAVIVHFQYGSTDLSELYLLEEQLEQVIADADVGEFDGNEIATDGSDGSLYMYGPDADLLWAAIRETIQGAPFMQGARAILRYGPPEPGIKQTEIRVGR